jgi:uncharacterized protein with HEPN domain
VSPSDSERRYLKYIRDSIDRIQRYAPSTLEDFLRDEEAQDAIIWRLQTLADAAKNHLSQELKARHPEIRWRAVYGFRNVAAHAYADVNLARVWEIVQGHLHPVRKAVEDELRP